MAELSKHDEKEKEYRKVSYPSINPMYSSTHNNLGIILIHKDAIPPKRASSGAAGYDLFCVNSFQIEPRQRNKIPTGIIIEIPDGHYGRIAPRSGLSIKHGIDVAAGVIDSDYRGEVQVVLHNNSDQHFHGKKGDRIAQLILEKISIFPVQIKTQEEISQTHRGSGGFGWSGV